MITVIHYMNQFGAGFGSEDKADMKTGVFDGPKGAGAAFQVFFGDRAAVVKTIYAGDNYANEFQEDFLNEAMAVIREVKPDVLIAGPAFNSGRYGLACGSLLKRAKEELGIPGVAGFGPDNPGITEYRKDCYAILTGAAANSMRQAIGPMGALALKLGNGEPVGPARIEGYIPRGVRLNVNTGRPSAERALDMALARLAGRDWETELPRVVYDRVTPPPPVVDLSKATVALVSEGGVVPAGNPDHMETNNSTKWRPYAMSGDELAAGRYEVRHGGYLTGDVTESPDRMVPYDALRALEKQGVIGKVHPNMLTASGSMANLSTMQRLGREMGEYLRKEGVDAVLLTAT